MDHSLLEAALVGYQRQRDDIDAKIAELQTELGGSAKRTSAGGGTNA